MLMAGAPRKIKKALRMGFFRQEANVRVYGTGGKKAPQLVVRGKQEVQVEVNCRGRSSGTIVGFDQQPARLPQLLSREASPGN